MPSFRSIGAQTEITEGGQTLTIPICKSPECLGLINGFELRQIACLLTEAVFQSLRQNGFSDSAEKVI